MAVKRLETVIRETEIEVRNRLAVQSDGADVSNIVHIELGLIHLVNARLGAVEIHTHRDSNVGIAIDTDTARVLGEGGEIASEGSEGPRHRLEARGAPEFGL